LIEVVEAGRSFVSSKIANDELPASVQDDAYQKLLVELSAASYMAVPLTLRGETLGIVSFISTDENRLYSQSDVAIAEELARRAAVAIENARLYQEAQQALRLRDQFLSIAAHELKTPLTALLGNTQLIQRRIARTHTFTERDQRVLQVINQQSQRLSRMVEALLDISRIRGGTLSIERTSVDLSALAERLVDEVQPSLERHSIEIHIPNSPVMVTGDALRLEQVFQNIIQNAIKYTPQGGKIALEITREGDQACVAVTDPGIGIPSKALPNLFRQFYRAGNAQSHHIAGMGLGLYVVREIVALHNGRVEVESTEGEGSTFLVYLPLIRDSLGVGSQSNKTPTRTNGKGPDNSRDNDARQSASAQRTA